MVRAAAELALSCLPHAHALNPNEIQRAILQVPFFTAFFSFNWQQLFIGFLLIYTMLPLFFSVQGTERHYAREGMHHRGKHCKRGRCLPRSSVSGGQVLVRALSEGTFLEIALDTKLSLLKINLHQHTPGGVDQQDEIPHESIQFDPSGALLEPGPTVDVTVGQMMPGPTQAVVVTSTQPPPQPYAAHPTITTLAPIGRDSQLLAKLTNH